MDTVTINIPSISCSMCANKIREGMQSMEGIKDVNVNLKSQAVTVNYDSDRINKQGIIKKISSLGYEVVG